MGQVAPRDEIMSSINASLARSKAHFIKGLIEIRWKFPFAPTPILTYWSLRNFAHSTTAVPPWHCKHLFCMMACNWITVMWNFHRNLIASTNRLWISWNSWGTRYENSTSNKHTTSYTRGVTMVLCIKTYKYCSKCIKGVPLTFILL